jgi:DNA-binding Lrp family transcriptional regulator
MSQNISLDLKDKRILRELFRNGRMPFSKIAKNVGLSKQVVHYRINRLHENGLLLGFNSVYDIKRIGWQMYLVYIKFKSINNKKEESIISELIKHKNIAWTIKTIGNYDIILKIFVKDISELNIVIKQIESKYENNFDTYTIDTIKEEHTVPVPFLYDPLKYDWEQKPKQKGTIKIDKLDIKILEQLAKNSRMQLSDMATKIDVSRDLIKYHLKKLEKQGVILNYRPSAWSGSKSVGYSWYLITLNLRQLDNQKIMSLLSFLKKHTYITYVYELIGQHDIGFEIRLKTGDELNDVLMELRSLLSEDLKRHELNLLLKEFKYTYFPECLKENISK